MVDTINATQPDGKLPLAADLPQSASPSAPAVTRQEGASEMAAVAGGGGAESGSSSGLTLLSKEQQSTEGRRLHAPEASRPHVGLGIGDFAVMGKLGEGGYGTVLLARHKTTHLMYAQQ